MKISTKQYVKSLFEISVKNDKTDGFISDLEALDANMQNLKNLMQKPDLNQDKKRNMLTELNISNDIINFLFILNDNKNLDKLASILRGVKDLKNKMSNTLEVEIETANPLNSRELDNIKNNLTKILNKNIILSAKTNTTLIGGSIFRIGDSYIDNSIKTKLNNLKIELIK